MSDVTRQLEAAAAGDRKAAAKLLPLVYDELCKLAAAKMAAEMPGHTLDATDLVHETYLRLTGTQSFESRSNFMRAAAEAMRRILVDHARARARPRCALHFYSAVSISVQPFESTFVGGVYIATGDIDGDGIADLIVTPDEGGGRAQTGLPCRKNSGIRQILLTTSEQVGVAITEWHYG